MDQKKHIVNKIIVGLCDICGQPILKKLDDNQTEGCGFIPCDILCKFLGQGQKAQNAEALQVRVVSPYFGILKGMLVAKVGIDKIQLPLTTRKKLNLRQEGRKIPKLMMCISWLMVFALLIITRTLRGASTPM